MKYASLRSTLIFAGIVALCPLVTISTAIAQTSLNSSVKTEDLDLKTAAGQKKLKLRLMHVVSETCPIGSKCRAPALKRAYQDADALIAAAKNGGPVPLAMPVQP